MKLYKENRNTRNRKILAAVLCALIMGAALSPASLAAETRDSRPHCPVCPQGYLSEQRDPIVTDDDEGNCQHGGEGLDIWEIKSQGVHLSCSDCSYRRDYTDYNFPQKLLYCPLWH